jgi:hypothetical protein
MKHMKLFASFCVLAAFEAAGQTAQKFVVNPGQRIADVLTPKDIYRFPEFKSGTVYFYDDRKIDAPLNYNLLTQTVQFISPNNDTLSLADEKEIKAIGIDGHYYLYRDGYYEVKNAFGKNKFLARQSIRIANIKKIGAYGQTVEGGANTYTNFSNGATDVTLMVNTKTTLLKEETYFFADENNGISSASKKSLLKLLSKNEDTVGNFIEANAIDFKKKTDIEKLIAYLNSL